MKPVLPQPHPSLVHVEYWSVVSGGTDPDTDPSVRISGLLYGHPEYPEGEDNTPESPIESASGRVVKTRDGREYILGRPDPGWLRFLKDAGQTYDPKNPLNFIDFDDEPDSE